MYKNTKAQDGHRRGVHAVPPRGRWCAEGFGVVESEVFRFQACAPRPQLALRARRAEDHLWDDSRAQVGDRRCSDTRAEADAGGDGDTHLSARGMRQGIHRSHIAPQTHAYAWGEAVHLPGVRTNVQTNGCARLGDLDSAIVTLAG